jgi:hypothetical protein
MKRNILTLVLLVAIICSNSAFAQKKKARIQPGRMYEVGDTLYAPRFGFTATVPMGWEGMLPRENEVFLLTSTQQELFGEIYIFGREQGNLAPMAEVWARGFELSESIKMKATKPEIKDGMLSSEVVAVGEFVNAGYKGFAASRCSQYGPCITTLMVAPVQFYEPLKNIVIQFMSSSTFELPSHASPYTDFDWKEFLSDKVVANYTSIKGGTKESTIHLCADGTFQSDIKKSGILKNQNPNYRGRQTGKWTVSGTGEEATIQFTFSKQDTPPFEATLKIHDEKVYGNGDRYFIGKSEKCKPAK